jgi:hypothetical protein
VQDAAGVLKMYDVNGKMVFTEPVAPWSQFKRMELSGLSKGIYFCKLRWGDKETASKIIIE